MSLTRILQHTPFIVHSRTFFLAISTYVLFIISGNFESVGDKLQALAHSLSKLTLLHYHNQRPELQTVVNKFLLPCQQIHFATTNTKILLANLDC